MNAALESIYLYLHKTPADTNEHLPTLRSLACECEDVVEIGCWAGISTTGLLCGLLDRLNTGRLRVVDINPDFLRHVDGLLSPHKKFVDLEFIEADSAEVEIGETDFIFIDSLHTYTHLKKELEKHGDCAKKYLAFHDTVTYGDVSEDGTSPGLMQAITEFMEESGKWAIKHHYPNNNGLLVLERL